MQRLKPYHETLELEGKFITLGKCLKWLTIYSSTI